ncbi:MAG: DUF7134 domain-containing protein [Streptosporangiaceae bacterium]
MRLLQPVEYPAHRRAARWVFDAAVTLVATASAVPSAVHDNAHPNGAAIAVLALVAVPLLVRRIWPIPVFGFVVAASAVTGLVPHIHAINGPAVLIATYTVAATQPRREALACAAVLELVMIAAVIRLAGGGWWYDAIFLSGLIAAALGLGLYSATRRACLAELHDRAARLERERDQEGALAAAAERARIAREMQRHRTDLVGQSPARVDAGFCGAAGADPQEAESGQDEGEGEVDPGLIPLEGPVAARGLVGHRLLEVQAFDVVVACLGRCR